MTNYWEEIDDGDEDEEDFDPEDCDDDEESVEIVDDHDVEDDPENFPSILQGQLFFDERKRICYEQDGTFCLVCNNSFPQSFTFEAPLIDIPMVFVGWIHDPSRKMEFEVVFSKESMSEDPLQIQLLEAQENIPLCQGSSTRTKTDNKYIDDACAKKKSGSLKAPPLHSLKTNQDATGTANSEVSSSNMKAGNIREIDEGEMSHRKSISITPSSEIAKIGTKSAHQDMLFIVSGSQIGNNPTDGSSISFRGAYRCPSKALVKRIHLICPIQMLDASKLSAFPGGEATVAAASKKRIRPGSDDDEFVEGNAGVAYQELIDLHDDTRLSTEELRNRYYGSGEKNGKYQNNVADIKRLKGISNGGCHKKDVEDDDDDDAYGF